ncbi:hypothetical protein Hanom_Chr12g01081661 [Helianthus anomalus]|nr:hypothetical protein HanIR_Chr10g0489211 [Helianthus annuus]
MLHHQQSTKKSDIGGAGVAPAQKGRTSGATPLGCLAKIMCLWLGFHIKS